MYKSSLSPRLAIRSPKSIDIAIQPKKLPCIKERTSMIPVTKSENLSAETKLEIQKKNPNKVINFFDIPAPIDERKLAIVRNTLEKRKITSPTNTTEKDLERDSFSSTNLTFKNTKSELELQIEFLYNRSSKKKQETVSSSDLSSKDPATPLVSLAYLNDSPVKSASLIKKSESIQSVPSYSPISQVPDSSSKYSSEGKKSLDQTDQISALKQEIFSLQQKIDQLSNDLSSQILSNDQLSRNFHLEKQSLLKDLQNLTNQINNLQTALNEAKDTIRFLKKEIKKLKTELANFKENKSEAATKIEAKIFQLKEELQEKQQEFEVVKEQLKNSEIHRKKFVEMSKDLELELVTNKKIKENAEFKLVELNSKIEELRNEIKEERGKNVMLEEIKMENFQVKYEMSLIREECKKFEMDKRVALESLDTVQKNFNNSRIGWRDKENEYNNTIQDLLEQIQNERTKVHVQAAESAKLRRALTIKDNGSVNNISKDEITRYQQKLMSLDKEHNEAMTEIEKLKRNIDYYRHILKNKEEIIKKLENSNVYSNESTTFNELKNFFNDFQKLVRCNKCCSVACTLCIQPCCHLVCQSCSNPQICPICSNNIESSEPYLDLEKIKSVFACLEPLLINKN